MKFEIGIERNSAKDSADSRFSTINIAFYRLSCNLSFKI